MIRLNKLLADRGLGARRKCDEMIQSGAVQVNGAVVTEPGTQVEPERDRVEVNGRPLPRESERRTFMLNKPVGVISTLSDPEGRRSLRDFLPPGQRLFPVGRLDADTSGLLLLTNDGELAHHLMHPRYGVAKRYRVHVDREPTESELKRLQDGVEFEPGVTSSPAQVWTRDASGGESVIEIAIHEGRHRQVRRMCEAVGLEVHRLHRYGYGPLKLGELERGMWRELSEAEIAELRAGSARPAPRAGGFTGQRSFDRPGAVRPRRDRPALPRPTGSATPEQAPRPERAKKGRFERPGERAGRGSDRPEYRSEGRWPHPETQVWRAEEPGAAPETKRRERSGGFARGGPRPRTGAGARPDRGAPRAGGAPFRGSRGPRPAAGGFPRERPAGGFERGGSREGFRGTRERPGSGRPGSDRPGSGGRFPASRPSGGPRRDGFAGRTGRAGGPPDRARRPAFGAGRPRREDAGPRGPRPGAGSGRPPRAGGPRREGFGSARPREGFGDGGPRREGFGSARPRREGFGAGGPRREGTGAPRPRREGFGAGGPRREGFTPARREGGRPGFGPRAGARPGGRFEKPARGGAFRPDRAGSGFPPRRSGGTGRPGAGFGGGRASGRPRPERGGFAPRAGRGDSGSRPRGGPPRRSTGARPRPGNGRRG